jgi:chromosome segregation ATPase
VQQKSIDKSIEDALKKIVAQKSVVSSLEAQKSDRDDETTKIFDDQQRLRENMKALKGSAEEKVLLQRYTRQLNDQEDRLEALKKEIKDLDAKVDAAQEELDKMIAGLSFDVKM